MLVKAEAPQNAIVKLNRKKGTVLVQVGRMLNHQVQGSILERLPGGLQIKDNGATASSSGEYQVRRNLELVLEPYPGLIRLSGLFVIGLAEKSRRIQQQKDDRRGYPQPS